MPQDQQDQIDAVITWVDGSDPVLAEKRRRYLSDPTIPGAAATRFASNDEVLYCTLSILRFAPFFRKIWFVTDNQTPPVFDAVNRLFPDQAHKLGVVDHREIFACYEEALPTFNSTTINLMLHRIPGLAERFIYFNDDFFLVRQTAPEDFFQGTRPVLRGIWMGRKMAAKLRLKAVLNGMRTLTGRPPRLSGIPGQVRAARIVGCKTPFVSAHVPYPMRRSVMTGFEKAQPDAFRHNLRHRFRDPSQFVAEALANHIEIRAGNHVLAPEGAAESHVYINLSRNDIARVARRLKRIDKDENRKFLCVQSMDGGGAEKQRLVLDWLKARIVARPGPEQNDRKVP